MMHASLFYLTLAGMGLSTVMIIRSVWSQRANLFLGANLLVLSVLILLFSSGFSNEHIFRTALLREFGIALFFSVGPLAFFYVREMLSNNSKLSASDLFHFSPVAVQVAAILPYLLTTGPSLIPAGVNLAFCILHLFIYLVILYTKIFKYKKINLLRFLNVRSYKLRVRGLIAFTLLVAVIPGYILFLAFNRNELIPSGEMTGRARFVTGNNEWVLLTVMIILIMFTIFLSGLTGNMGIQRARPETVPKTRQGEGG